jgi:hypothetical protein
MRDKRKEAKRGEICRREEEGGRKKKRKREEGHVMGRKMRRDK